MVEYKTDGQFTLLEINNPPVNALSYPVRDGLLRGIKKAIADDKIKAVIIVGNGKTFLSGADIKEFSKQYKGPDITDVGRVLEASLKPVICAVHGQALGGGLEIALFSHYRIADSKAKFGFPEVLLGLLPGRQGTIRLPRVTGLTVAIDLITSGRHISAQDALKYGIIDKIVTGDLLAEAKSFAANVIGKPLDTKRLSQIPLKGAENADQLFENALTAVKKKYKGMIAPTYCLKSIRGAVKLPFEEAAENEHILFRELMTSGQSEALRYSFFAERAVSKWKLPSGASALNTKPLLIQTAAVIGAGTMGSGIAICLIRSGIPVVLIEQNAKMLEVALRNIGLILQDSVKRNRMTTDKRIECLRILRGANSLDKVSEVDIVIEAVYENLKLKQEIFAQLDKICKPSTLLCSNTSTLEIEKLASVTKRPDKVAGTHFFSPAHIMRLLENVYGLETSPTTVATIMDLGKRIGKVSVLVRSCHGFVANRMNKNFDEAQFLLEEGATIQDIDRVYEEFGMPMGVFKVSDLAGTDIRWLVQKEKAKLKGITFNLDTRYINGERYCTIADRICELGRFGIKTGKGWYKYESTNPHKAIPDPEVTDIVLTHCKNLGITRRQISYLEILERCFYATINEGFKILEEGIAEKPEDIDIIWQAGFAFPKYRGGPMFYASQVGLTKVYERICYYHKTFPYSIHWVPSNLLKKLASHSSQIPISQWMNFSNSKL
ncbi:peroxisomal bifunctional enzyme-like [Physella acuta]|uniref:peroxisomal bifunctional enzyme-like n=1 Tax=Physella acuta TaxID=109671 RepID=UPI0027DB3651|nr:peroxisomal bifunctional enzyme-like [Physella acuta]